LRVFILLVALWLGGCAGVKPAAVPPSPENAAAPLPTLESQVPQVVPPEPQVPVPFEGERVEIKDPLRKLPAIDRTVPPDDLWERIRRGFAIQDLDSKLVNEKIAAYKAQPEYLQRVFNRSRLYLYHIVEELEKRGMPTEIALLPMVESAFNPMAYSRAHASGLWQFIPGTGKRYDLDQNWWYDGRRDIVDSTAAALEYLTRLYEMHGDWQLALASYNWGENAVARAIAKNKAAGLPADYAHLKMPAETRHYIPKLQALKNIIRDPQAFGIDLGPLPNQPYFATYDEVRDIDVQLAAKLAEMPVEEFIALNPGFSRPIIRAANTPRIVLPADKIDVFRENLEKHDKSLVSWKSYHPKKGDTLESIAKKHGLSLAQLKEVNGISARSKNVPSLLVVPVNISDARQVRKLPIMYAPPIPVRTRRVYHTVRSGDTMHSVAKRYGVAVEDLQRWNGTDKIRPGQRLAVEVRAPTRRTASKKAAKGKPKAEPKGKVYKKADR